MALNDILQQFRTAAADPAALKARYLAEGRKVVLTAPVYTPEEIVHAMGAVPMGAWGADCELSGAKRYFPAFICSIMQSILELGMNGTYEGASAIVIPSLCDSLKCLGENWKYAVKDIPFIPMTYPQNRAIPAGVDFTEAGYQRVIRDLEKALDTKFDDKALAASIAVYNEHNAVMRALPAALCAHPEISAADRSAIFKSATFLRKEEHTALVKELLAELEKTPAGKAKTKIVTSGILADSASLNGIFDDLGLQIAADDVAAESRQYRTDAPEAETALRALALKFSKMDHCSVLYDVEKKRAQLIVDMVKDTGAAGVVLVLTKFCDPEEFDYVPIKRACDAAGIPLVLVEVDRQMQDYGQARTLLETFCDML